MQPTDQTIEQKLVSWLEGQGYPLEMRVARIFQAQSFRVIQSDYYTDPHTGDAREVDVVATMQDYVGRALLRVAFMIECKSSRDKPWLLFASNRRKLARPAMIAQRAASEIGHRVLEKLAMETKVQGLPLFHVPENPAYSLTQAFTTGIDICYGAATSIATAAMARASEMSKRISGLPPIIEIIFPIIVTEARLFAVSLNEDNTVSVNERTDGVLLWRNPLVGMQHTIIQVITAPAMAGIADTLGKQVRAFIALCSGDLKEAFASAPARKRSG